MKQENLAFSKRIAILLVTLTACIGCDQSTKYAARSFLESGEIHSYLGDTVRVVYAENSGAFLGLGASLPKQVRTALFVVLASGFVLGLAIYTIRKSYLALTELSAIALIVGGGVGNLTDRILNNGVVVDFLNIGVGSLRTGIFNVADMILMVGVAVFVFSQGKPAPT